MRNIRGYYSWFFPASPRRLFFVPLILITFLLPVGADAQSLAKVDIDLFRSINRTQSPQQGLFDLLDAASGPTFVAVPAALVVVGVFDDQPDLSRAGAIIGAGQILAGGSAVLLKVITARPRPFDALDDVKVKRRSSATGFAFPSGHTALAFALATSASLCLENPYASLPLFVWAGMVGYGRIYLGLHYPSDVLGGIVLGVASAWVVWQFREEIESFVDNNLTRQHSRSDRQSLIHIPSTELLRLQIRIR